MAYSGKYIVMHPEKYEGDPSKVFYRSLWERQVFKWCESNSDVVSWNSEETVIPYRCATDRKIHRYFVDLKVVLKSGKTLLVEIKPKKETTPPTKPARQTKKYLTEALTFIKNQSKWEAANEYCMSRGWQFVIWTEDTLKQLGIKIVSPSMSRKK